MKHRFKHVAMFVIIASAVVTAGCSEGKPSPTSSVTSGATVASPTIQATATRTPRPQATPTPTVMPTRPRNTPTPTPEPTATSEPTPTATPSPGAPAVRVEPTLTPRPGDEEISVALLPIGQPGNVVNVTFGYWLQYPVDWYTNFGNRPLLVSLSDLDPGAHNRQSMREQGCLIEVNASSNIYGFTFETLAAQLPRGFADVREIELGGESAWSVPRGGDSIWESEWVHVQHDGRLFTLVYASAREAEDVCLPAWENMLATWRWFEPSLAEYRNPSYGFAISYPRRWYLFNAHQAGISISDQDPAGITDWPGFMQSAMVVETNVFDNDRRLPLKEWLAAYNLDVHLANDIPLDELVGVRVITDGPGPGIEAMNGYFQGPLGRIYEISCLYPADQKWVYRPIANAIIYSFNF